MLRSSSGEVRTYEEAIKDWLVIQGTKTTGPIIRTQEDITKSCLYQALKQGSNIKYIQLTDINHKLIKVSRTLTEHLKWKSEEGQGAYIDVVLKSNKILTIVL